MELLFSGSGAYSFTPIGREGSFAGGQPKADHSVHLVPTARRREDILLLLKLLNDVVLN
jgi:hypothetical protein